MPTVVGILTFIRMINTTSERLKARNIFYLTVFLLLSAVEVSCSVELSMKKCYDPGPALCIFDLGLLLHLKSAIRNICYNLQTIGNYCKKKNMNHLR